MIGIITNMLKIKLSTTIKNISNCEIKNNATKLVFSDGNFNSKIMVVGEGPGQKDEEAGPDFITGAEDRRFG